MSSETKTTMTEEELQGYLIKIYNEIHGLSSEVHTIAMTVSEKKGLSIFSDWANSIIRGETTFGSNPDTKIKGEELRKLARNLSSPIAYSIDNYADWARDGKIVNLDLDNNPMLNELGGAKEHFLELIKRINMLARKAYYAFFRYMSDSKAKDMMVKEAGFYDVIASSCLHMHYKDDIRRAKEYYEKPKKSLKELIDEEGSNDHIIRNNGFLMVATVGKKGTIEVDFSPRMYENHDAVLKRITALSPEDHLKNKQVIDAAYHLAFSLEEKFRKMSPVELKKYAIGNMKLTPEEKEAFDTDICSYMEQIGTHK